MSQIMYNYPAMLAHAGDMSSYAGTLQGLGADIASSRRRCPMAGRATPVRATRPGRRSGTKPWRTSCVLTSRWRPTTNPTPCPCWARDGAEAAKWGG